MDTFEDIRIVDLDAERTSWSRVDTSLRTVYLRLNAPPPGVAWVKFFHEERDSRVMARRRGLWIENHYIVLDCFPEEIEPHHLPDLQRSIDYANAKYREFLATEAEKWRELTRLDEQEQQSLAALRERLRASVGAAPVAAEPVPAVVAPPPPAPAAPLVTDELLSAHDRAIAAGQRGRIEVPALTVRGSDAMRADDAARAAVAPAVPPAAPVEPIAAPAPVAVEPATPLDPVVAPAPVVEPPAAPALPAAAPADAAPAAPKPVDDGDVERYLAQYRAKVRAAFRGPSG